MATVTEGSYGSEISFSGDGKLDSLLGWAKWGGSQGTGATVTFSFPTSAANFANVDTNEMGGYDPSREPSGFAPMTEAQKAGVRTALAAWAEVADITFVETPDNASETGDIRFSNSSFVGESSSNAAAWAYLPDSWGNPVNGDVWVDQKYSPNFQMAAGQYGLQMLMHEIGHAIGLVTSN